MDEYAGHNHLAPNLRLLEHFVDEMKQRDADDLELWIATGRKLIEIQIDHRAFERTLDRDDRIGWTVFRRQYIVKTVGLHETREKHLVVLAHAATGEPNNYKRSHLRRPYFDEALRLWTEDQQRKPFAGLSGLSFIVGQWKKYMNGSLSTTESDPEPQGEDAKHTAALERRGAKALAGIVQCFQLRERAWFQYSRILGFGPPDHLPPLPDDLPPLPGDEFDGLADDEDVPTDEDDDGLAQADFCRTGDKTLTRWPRPSR